MKTQINLNFAGDFGGYKVGTENTKFLVHTTKDGNDNIVAVLVDNGGNWKTKKDNGNWRVKVLKGASPLAKSGSVLPGQAWINANIERTKPIAAKYDWNDVTDAQVAEIEANLVDDAGAPIIVGNLPTRTLTFTASELGMGIQCAGIGKYGDDTVSQALNAAKAKISDCVLVDQTTKEFAVKSQTQVLAYEESGVVTGLPLAINGTALSGKVFSKDFTVFVKPIAFAMVIA